jgi:ankyrin repeat protein
MYNGDRSSKHILIQGSALLFNNSLTKADPNICFAGMSTLYIASCHGHVEIIKLLLNNKADPNICFAGESPLYIAYFHGHAEIVELDNLCMTFKRSDV